MFRNLRTQPGPLSPAMGLRSRTPNAGHMQAGRANENVNEFDPPWGASWDACSALQKKGSGGSLLGIAQQSRQRSGPKLDIRMTAFVAIGSF